MFNDKCSTMGIHLYMTQTIPRGEGKGILYISIRTAFNVEVLHWQMFCQQCRGKKTPLQGCTCSEKNSREPIALNV